MSACMCAGCAPAAAPTYTERYRHECELRWLAGLPRKDDRRRHLRHVALKRGAEAAERLLHGLRMMPRSRR